MISRMEISGIHMEVGDDLKKYVEKKIGHMDRFIPKHARKSAHAEVKLKEKMIKNKNNCTCEVVLYLPGEQLTTKETTVNIYAAVDIVETKLKNQLKKYKDKHTSKRTARRLLQKIRSRKSR